MVFWADQVAEEVLARASFKYIERAFEARRQNVETGTSISGVPHIGNASDIIRGEAIRRALSERGAEVALTWVADDMDPFRKVPKNLPPEYRQYLGMPVSSLPDPFGCCPGYVEHYVRLFISSLERFGVEPLVRSGRQLYASGQLTPYVRQTLERRELVREVLDKYRTQPLPEDWIPYDPICEGCGRIATPRPLGVDGDKVLYVCEDATVAAGATEVKGCGHRGEADITKGQGKLPWKPEWAARWALFGVTCEPFGKEHATIPGGSFWVNGELCERVFGWPEPYPVIYEFVLAAGGQKMSSSKGNTVATWEWPDIAPPEALKLFFYKKLAKQREFDLAEVPRLVDELDRLERVYFFGLEREGAEGSSGRAGRAADDEDEGERLVGERRLEHLRRLYEMCAVGRVPELYVRSIPFRFAAIVVQLVPEERMEERALDLLRRTGHLAGEVAEEERARVRERLSQAKEWVGRHAPPEVRISLLPEVGAEVKASLAPEVRSALADVAAALADEAVTEEALNRAVFDAARAHGISSGQMFTACYRVLLGTKGGPRLAPFLLTLDRAFVRRRLAELA